MINVEKVKKAFSKSWKFFAAKPAYAWIRYRCIYCGRTSGSQINGSCAASPSGKHCWEKYEE